MNEQEMFLRVGELAGRVGYPMPTVTWVEGVSGEDCIRFQENREGAATFTVHDHVDEFATEQEQELIIGQALVQARLGVARQRRRLKVAMFVLGAGAGLIAIQVANRLVAGSWLPLVLGVACAYVVLMPVQALVNFVWCRSMNRRVDQALIEVFGRDRVVAWLKLYAHLRPPAQLRLRLRWLMSGAPPLAAGRLRGLGEQTAAR